MKGLCQITQLVNSKNWLKVTKSKISDTRQELNCKFCEMFLLFVLISLKVTVISFDKLLF